MQERVSVRESVRARESEGKRGRWQERASVREGAK